jgi:hypothetical protein
VQRAQMRPALLWGRPDIIRDCRRSPFRPLWTQASTSFHPRIVGFLTTPLITNGSP